MTRKERAIFYTQLAVKQLEKNFPGIRTSAQNILNKHVDKRIGIQFDLDSAVGSNWMGKKIASVIKGDLLDCNIVASTDKKNKYTFNCVLSLNQPDEVRIYQKVASYLKKDGLKIRLSVEIL